MFTTETISAQLRENFVTLIAQQTGIEIRSQNYGSLSDNILSRVKALHLASPQAYYDLLVSLDARGEEEWQQFVCLVTNRESYFFRDKGQFALLRQSILPELIRQNQRTKILRICSAGCSTGQEPYSLAILLRELIPDIDSWSVNIYGIDINRESLDHALKGLYNVWSFRQVEDDIKDRYFKNLAGYYQLDPQVKRAVKFQQVNLVRDPLPRLESDIRDMDLIICRNVFIYFTDQAIARVVEKFFNTLKMNGYLLTGHAELGSHHVKAFHSKLFPESVIYQKRSSSFSSGSATVSRYHPPEPKPSALETLSQQLEKTQIKLNQTNGLISRNATTKPVTTAPAPLSPTPTVAANSANQNLLQEARTLLQSKSYHLAQKKLEQLLQTDTRNAIACCLMAEIKANLGQYDQAQEWCQKATGFNAFDAKPYHLLAHIAEEQGNLESAKQALKKIIYLEPYAVPAYVNLANLYQQEGDRQRANKMQQSALKILQGLPSEQTFEELGHITADELISQLQRTF
ncbi:MAG: CheR family methyltransferase [Merismopediaceae bacterium]|nr:CheR family methyltransferase [Merismopediaceae bacterium]